jgi:hypothetical protein
MTLQAPRTAVGSGGSRGEKRRPGVEIQTEKFLADNPKLQEALEVVKISTEQYARALQALSTPAVYTVTGSNDGTGVLNGDLVGDQC